MNIIDQLRIHHRIELNEQQQQALLDIDGPQLLLAVPGAGKTTVMVARCANMILNHGIDPGHILSLTFSKASAIDMKHRFQQLFGEQPGSNLQFSTIHSFCYGVLHRFYAQQGTKRPELIEDSTAPMTKIQLLRRIYQEQNNKDYPGDDLLEELIHAIGYVKNMRYATEQISQYPTGIKTFPAILEAYEEQKRKNHWIDYDDLLVQTLEIFSMNSKMLSFYRDRYRYIQVDEAQDVSYIQHEIIMQLAHPRNQLFMVGDEDQSIYAFRAAFPKALLEFETTYPGAKVYTLEKNYRSTGAIVCAAQLFIEQNSERRDKTMQTDQPVGCPIALTTLPEKESQYAYVASKIREQASVITQAILYRNNNSAIPMIDVLNRSGIPFHLRSSQNRLFSHWVVTDLLAFMKLALNPNDVSAFRQIYFKMNAFISKTVCEEAIEGCCNKNIWDALATIDSAPSGVRQKALEMKGAMQSIAKSSPLQAIERIEEQLGYSKYLKRICKVDGYSLETLMSMVDALKSIASRVSSILEFFERIKELEKINQEARSYRGNSVTLSSIHSSKGLEFDKVFIIDLIEGQFPSYSCIQEKNNGNKAPMEEERRLFYVGITRAKEYLELVTATAVNKKSVKPSRFMEKLGRLQHRRITEVNDVNRNEESLDIGVKVIHRKFGAGTIDSIDGSQDLIEVTFDDGQSKQFSITLCVKNRLLTTVVGEMAAAVDINDFYMEVNH